MYELNPYATYRKNTPEDTPKKWLHREIATAESTSFLQWGFPNYNPDELVQKKGILTYNDMRKDDQIKACQQTKISARLSTGYEIKAGDEKNVQSREYAEYITDQLANIKGTFKVKLRDILTARDFGYSITEKVLGIIQEGRWAGKIGLVDLKTKEPYDFTFKTDEFRNLQGIIRENVINPRGDDFGSVKNPYPIHKFVVYSANKEFVNPYGRSDLREVYKAWWSKNFIMKFFNIYLERFGQPTIMASYPDKLSEDKDFLDLIDDLLSSYQTKTGFRIPDGAKVELLEAKRRGDAGYKDAIEMYDKRIARGLLWPDMALQAGEKGGSHALAKDRFSLFVLILDEMGYEIEDPIMQDQIIDPLILLNWGIVDKRLRPTFKFEPIHEANTELRAKIIDIMIGAGVVRADEEWVREWVNIPAKSKALIKEEKEAKKKAEDAENEDRTPPDEDESIEPFVKKKFEASELRRQPTEFESKVDFVQLNAEMDSYEEFMQAELEEVTKKWKRQVMFQADKIFKTNDNKAINKMNLKNTGEFKNILRDWLIKIHLDSKFRDTDVLRESGMDVRTEKRPIPKSVGIKLFSHEYSTFPEFDAWSPMPLKQSVEFFNSKRLAFIKKDGKEKRLFLANGKELRFYDDSAFAITGIEQQHILNQSKMIMFDAVKSGDTGTAFKNLDALFAKYIDEGAISENLRNPNRLDTIIRTNTNDALNRGREALFKDPDVDEFVPFVQVSAVRDDRTTDYCLGLDGKVFRKADAPSFPAHFSCFVAGTRITFKDASGNTEYAHKAGRPIERIILGDIVYTHNGNWKEVIQLHKNWYVGELIELELEDGKKVKATPNHPILTDKGWIEAGKLIGDENIITINNIKSEKQWENNDDRKKKASEWSKKYLAGRKPVTGKYVKCKNEKCTNLILRRPSRVKRGRELYCSTDCLIGSGDLAHKLEKHPSWQGGKSFEPYGIEFNDKLKRYIRNRDGNKCMECMMPQAESKIKLPVHHIDYDKQNNHEDNLITLCNGCNLKVNYNREDWQEYFKRMIDENKKFKENKV